MYGACTPLALMQPPSPLACPCQVLERRAQALVKESSDMAALALERQVDAEQLAGEACKWDGQALARRAVAEAGAGAGRS